MISKKKGFQASHADFSVSFRWAPLELMDPLLDPLKPTAFMKPMGPPKVYGTRGHCTHLPPSRWPWARARKHSALASAKMCEAFNSYCSMPVGDQDRTYGLHILLVTTAKKKLWKVNLVNILLLNLNCCVFTVDDKKPRFN